MKFGVPMEFAYQNILGEFDEGVGFHSGVWFWDKLWCGGNYAESDIF
jgi:hypothetical protein